MELIPGEAFPLGDLGAPNCLFGPKKPQQAMRTSSWKTKAGSTTLIATYGRTEFMQGKIARLLVAGKWQGGHHPERGALGSQTTPTTGHADFDAAIKGCSSGQYAYSTTIDVYIIILRWPPHEGVD